jgi:hypothetical protein
MTIYQLFLLLTEDFTDYWWSVCLRVHKILCVSETVCFPVSSKREHNLRDRLQTFGLCGIPLLVQFLYLNNYQEKVMIVHIVNTFPTEGLCHQ